MFGIYWNLSPSKSESGGWEYCKKPEICESNAGKETVSLPDYCNNPSDAWPIIFEHEISLVVVEDGVWVARFGSVFDESSNPLRSAMIVYLMMKDEEK